AGKGPALLMLQGGGPGATGMSNFIRNIPALADHFRVIVPDMPGYGGSTKRIDRADPFGDLASARSSRLGEPMCLAIRSEELARCEWRWSGLSASTDSCCSVQAELTRRARRRRRVLSTCLATTSATDRPEQSLRRSFGSISYSTEMRSETRSSTSDLP